MARRIILVGGPRVGKSTLAEKLQSEFSIPTLHTSAKLESLFPVDRSESWSQQSEFASKWFDDPGDWICEGVQMARALRKWLKANPSKPLDADLFLLRQPMVPQRDGQKAMMKGVESVFREIETELTRRGARIQKLKDPKHAIDILLARDGQDKLEKAGSLRMPKFTLKAKVEKLDDIAERYRPAYVEREGAFHLDPVKLEGIEFDDKAELDGAIKKERENKEKAERELKAEREKNAGVDIEEYNRLKAEADNKENDDLKSKGKIDELLDKQRTTLEAKHAAEKKTWQEEKIALTGELSVFKVDLRLRKAFEEAGVMTDRMDDAVELTKKFVKLAENDSLKFHDKNGIPLDVSPEGYAKEILLQEKAWLFPPVGGQGSDAKNGTHGSSGKKQYKRSDMNAQHPSVVAEWMKEVTAGKAELLDQ